MSLHPTIAFTQAIEQLEDEHEALKIKLQKFGVINTTIEQGEDEVDWFATLRNLKMDVERFMVELQHHANWEEQALFPMINLYAEENRTVLEVIEEDHLLAEQYLEAFLNELHKMVAPVLKKEAKELMNILMNGYQLLLNHFAAEERHVFPLADEIQEDIDYLSS